MKSHWSCELFPLVYQHKTLTFNGARFGLLASRHLRVNNNILLSLTGILSSPRNIDRSRADTWEISSLCLLQCGNFSLASPEAFKGRESTAMETDIPMIEVLQPVDLTNNLRLFPVLEKRTLFCSSVTADADGGAGTRAQSLKKRSVPKLHLISGERCQYLPIMY